MRFSWRQSAVVYLASIFVAGVMAGAISGYTYARKKVFKSARQEDMPALMCKRLQARLGLTPGQMRQIEPIMIEAGQEIHGEHCQAMGRVEGIVKEANRRINAILTPEQRDKLAVMEKEREEFFKHLKDQKDQDGQNRTRNEVVPTNFNLPAK
ncbi:MAG TPA: hypothetical protein VHH73_15500 [Verrucomicrobiae bacterium]|nr:hypothetical protein [Verrucomicrobiae bacterium]